MSEKQVAMGLVGAYTEENCKSMFVKLEHVWEIRGQISDSRRAYQTPLADIGVYPVQHIADFVPTYLHKESQTGSNKTWSTFRPAG